MMDAETHAEHHASLLELLQLQRERGQDHEKRIQ